MSDPTYYAQLRAFRDTYGSEVARGYFDEAVDTLIESGDPDTHHEFLLAIAFAAAETTMRVEIDSHVRASLGMIPDYIIQNDDGTWTVMLYETQREVRVGFGIMPSATNTESRPVRDLINDPEYQV